MRTAQTRLCIYPKDVQRITGKSERYGRMLLQKIKSYYRKEEHQFITVEEFCQYTGIKKEDAIQYIAA
jgi:hypothetical protein